MQGEGLFHTAAIRDAANRKGLGNAAAVTGDDSTLINLNSLSVALFDLVLDANRVADAEGRHLSLELLVCKSLD